MAKLIVFYVLACLCLLLTCSSATMYIVGDAAGWDVGTDLDSWVKNKNFNVGDVLLFQYTSANTVNEVTRDNFNGCSVNRNLKIYTGGNSTIPLTKPGDRFFVSGNKLYCLGGMKLQVHVNGSQVAGAPAGAPASSPGSAPQASTSLLPRPSTKNNNNNNNNASPNFSSSSNGSPYGGTDYLIAACFGAVVTLLSFVII